MEALGPEAGGASPASSTGSRDPRRLSARSSPAASGAALPYLDPGYVRAGRGGPAPARPPPLPALAAQARAGAPAVEPPSPPAARAAYRRRLQGAQRRVLRETSFQRRELRTSLPARLRPASLGLPASSEPAELALPGRGGRQSGGRRGKAAPSSEPRELQRGAPATQPRSAATERDSRLARLGNRPASCSRSAAGEAAGPGRGAAVQAGPQGPENPRSWRKLLRFLSQKDAALAQPVEVPPSGPAGGEQRVPETCTVSARPPCLPDDSVLLEEPLLVRMRSLPGSQAPRGLPTSTRACDQQCGTDSGQRAGQVTAPPEAPLHKYPGTAGTDDHWQGVNGSVGVSRPVSCSSLGAANGDTPSVDPPGPLTTDHTVAAENEAPSPPPAGAPEPSGGDTPGSPPDTGQPGSRPTRPGQRLEELVQELAKLDPSLSDTLASQPSPQLALGLLDGLIPLTEVGADLKLAGGAAGALAPGSCQLSFSQLLPPSQEDSRPEKPTPHPGPDQPSGQRHPEPTHSIQAKKAQLAGLLQEMLWDLQAQQERLQTAAQEWAWRMETLEAMVGRACAPRELERLCRFMADLERVFGLLLLLGSRLARVHRALAQAGPEGNPEERASLLQRLRLLQRQEEDAKELKEHVARRERALRAVLARALPAEGLHCYDDLLAAKASVLAQQRSLDERVRLLQDHLDAVRSDLGHSLASPRLSWPPGTCPPERPPSPPPPI